MPRKKIIGNCSQDNCNLPIDSLGLCSKHYRRQYYHGRLHKKNDNKRKHSLYGTWRTLIKNKTACEEWLYFWNFEKDVGIRPTSNHFLKRKDEDILFNKDNFFWYEKLKRLPNESKKEWRARKWAKRVAQTSAINGNRKVFKAAALPLRKFQVLRDQLFIQQNGCCAVCGKHEQNNSTRHNKPRRLALDHDHKTGKLRELLCDRCNTCLGRFEDSIPLLQNLIRYLQKHAE